MAEQKGPQGNPPERQGQNPPEKGTIERGTDPNQQRKAGQTGTERQGQGQERTGTERTESPRNTPEGDVEGVGNQGTR
jgi:hypothetical protein